MGVKWQRVSATYWRSLDGLWEIRKGLFSQAQNGVWYLQEGHQGVSPASEPWTVWRVYSGKGATPSGWPCWQGTLNDCKAEVSRYADRRTRWTERLPFKARTT